MDTALWFVVAGTLLTVMALAQTTLRRLPLSTAQLYLLVGLGLGPLGIGLLVVDPIEQAKLLEVVTEIVVTLSLFAAGLKLRTPLSDGRWKLPIRLATLSMTLTVAGIAAVGHWALGLPWGAAVLLGAVLAPTDPVLASDVQIESPDDTDRLRFSLTGEAGFNDGAAFPFVMLGLGLLGLHELGRRVVAVVCDRRGLGRVRRARRSAPGSASPSAVWSSTSAGPTARPSAATTSWRWAWWR